MIIIILFKKIIYIIDNIYIFKKVTGCKSRARLRFNSVNLVRLTVI